MRRDVPQYVSKLAADLRKEQTREEKIIWNKLRNKQLGGYRFTRQYPIGRYIADFYCSQALLAVEIDGEVHNTIINKEYDRIRDDIIKTHGVTVIRFTNQEIFDNLENVLNSILTCLKSNCGT